MRNENSGNGISFCGALFLIFLVLKLTGYIAWSWWWVTAPLWVPFAIAGAVLGMMALIAILAIGVAVVSEAIKRTKDE